MCCTSSATAASHRHCNIAPGHRHRSEPTLDKVAQGFNLKSIQFKMNKYIVTDNCKNLWIVNAEDAIDAKTIIIKHLLWFHFYLNVENQPDKFILERFDIISKRITSLKVEQLPEHNGIIKHLHYE